MRLTFPVHMPILGFSSLADVSLVVPPGELAPEEIRSDRQKSRVKKRKLMNDALAGTRAELFAGGFDG
jgi:tRNA (adenine58-N1)-methyltransferase non-catalytic subunit